MTTSLPDAKALAAELKSEIRGEVRFDDGSRALYATDGSNYRQVPIGVVIPESIDDDCNRCRLPQVRRAGALPRRWDQSGGPML